MNRTMMLISMIATALCMVVSSAYSADKPSLKFDIHGGVSWYDNIYLDATDTKSEFVYTLTPSLSYQVPFGKNYFEVLANLQLQQIGGDYTLLTPTGKILFRHNMSEKMSFAVWDAYTQNNIPDDLGEDFWMNTASVELKREFTNRTSGTIGYSYQVLDFPTTSLADYNDNKVSAGLSHMFGARTSVGLTVNWNDRSFDEPADQEDLKDYTSYGATVKMEKGVGAKSTLGAYLGFLNKDYKAQNPNASATNVCANEADDSFTTGGAYFYVPLTSKTSFKVFYDRSVEDTYYIYPGDMPLFPVSTVLDVYDATYRDVTSDRTGVTVSHLFGNLITGAIGFVYSKNKAGVEKLLPGNTIVVPLDEDVYETNVGLSYRPVKNWTFGIGYIYGNRSSEARGNYTYNKYALNAAYLF